MNIEIKKNPMNIYEVKEFETQFNGVYRAEPQKDDLLSSTIKGQFLSILFGNGEDVCITYGPHIEYHPEIDQNTDEAPFMGISIKDLEEINFLLAAVKTVEV